MRNPRLPYVLLLGVPIAILVGAGILVATTRSLTPAIACAPSDFTGLYEKAGDTANFDGNKIAVPQEVADNTALSEVLGQSDPSDRWIEVILSEQKIRAWNGNQLFLESPVSTGLSWFPTPKGEFRIWTKLRYTRMEGGQGALYYNLPNVPFVMFFSNDTVPDWRGYSLHGTYWHNDFGHPHSHGCVNLPTSVAEKLYYWAAPVLPAGKSSVNATADNPGTRIVIHD